MKMNLKMTIFPSVLFWKMRALRVSHKEKLEQRKRLVEEQKKHDFGKKKLVEEAEETREQEVADFVQKKKARRAEEEARLRAEEEARLRAEEEARRPQPVEEDLNFDDYLSDDNSKKRDNRKRTEETEEDYLSLNLEPSESKPKKSIQSQSSFDDFDSSYNRKTSTPSDSNFNLTARLGTSKYGAGLEKLVFVTYGAEVSVRAAAVSLNLVRKGLLQNAFIIDDVPVEFWNIIIPVNIGATYYLSSEKVSHVGADLLILPGYLRGMEMQMVLQREVVEGGADISITDSMVSNINASFVLGLDRASRWYSKDLQHPLWYLKSVWGHPSHSSIRIDIKKVQNHERST